MPNEAVWVRLVGGVEDHLATCQSGRCVSEVNHSRKEKTDAGVAMFLVVPGKNC